MSNDKSNSARTSGCCMVGRHLRAADNGPKRGAHGVRYSAIQHSITHVGAVAEHEGKQLGTAERSRRCHDEGRFKCQFVEAAHACFGHECHGDKASAVSCVVQVETPSDKVT